MRRSIASKIVMIATAVLLLLFCISLLLPFFWMIISSFKDPIDYVLNVFGFPEKWYFTNYARVFDLLEVKVVTTRGVITYGVVEMFLYSLLIATVSAFMGVFVPAITAYIVAKYNFRIKKLLYNIALVVMIIPIVGSLPSALRIYNALGLYNNIIPFLIFNTGPFGFNFILLYGAFKSLSWNFAEAAFIDGAGHGRVMFQIMFPMMMPTFVTLFVLGFIGSWNNYMLPVVWLPSYPNLAYGMYYFQLEAPRLGAAMPEVLAGFVIVAVPTSILYLCSQNLILKNMRVGGLKG